MTSILITDLKGRELISSPGLPGSYQGVFFPSATAKTWVDDTGLFTVQEILRGAFTLRYHAYTTSPGTRVKLIRKEEGLQSAAVLQCSCRQTVPGVGRISVDQGLFTAFIGKHVETMMEFGHCDPFILVDTAWHKGLLERYLPPDSEWWERLNNSTPKLIGEPFRRVTSLMEELLWNLKDAQYEPRLQELAIDHLVKEYLIEVLQESGRTDWLTGIISRSDLDKIEAAKQWIASDIEAHHSTPEIARAVGLNECKLKALFRKVTGKGTFEYLLYLRCSAVRDKMLETNLPIKAFVSMAGYRNYANFVTGFKRHLGINPSQVRK